jgi:hypothetical protein
VGHTGPVTGTLYLLIIITIIIIRMTFSDLKVSKEFMYVGPVPESTNRCCVS